MSRSVMHLIQGAGPGHLLGGLAPMRRPALHRTTGHATTTAWSHPYPTDTFSSTFYVSGDPDPAGPPAVDQAPAEAPKPSPPTGRTFTQAEVEALTTREKAQGKRSAAKEFAEKHGFNSIEDAEAFIAAARQSEEATLSEQQKRERDLADREARADAREKAAADRERVANRRAVLVGLGSTGEDLDDAAALLRVPDDADDATINAAAEALKGRRPELFGARPAIDPAAPQLPPAPGGAPAGGPPARQTPTGKPGDRGREMARQRGHKAA